MKKLLVLGSIVLVLNSCSKSDDTPAGCTYTAPTAIADPAEVTTLQAYATSNYPAAIKHSSGFFYEISAPGAGGITPGPCTSVKVNYALYSIPANVKLEEPPSPVTFVLGGLIQGWQYGIPLIRAGGSIMLLVPPSLAYNDGRYLKFYISLIDVQ